MKRVAFFILAILAIAIADDIEEIAKTFDTDVETVQTCVEEVEVNTEEIYGLIQKWGDITDASVDENIKDSLTKYSLFLACILEKNGMMIDTKLVINKILESLEKDKEIAKLPNKEALMGCMNTLNESDMTREDRVFGLMLCAINGQMNGKRK